MIDSPSPDRRSSRRRGALDTRFLFRERRLKGDGVDRRESWQFEEVSDSKDCDVRLFYWGRRKGGSSVDRLGCKRLTVKAVPFEDIALESVLVRRKLDIECRLLSKSACAEVALA
eukprot:m.311240 g.311240  ORF g.311240 m.311240 type:complete len:115 (+) comp63030_c0_seq1:279-623(+)